MKQVISILLSILMLLSSTGIAYAQHFCGDYEMLTEITLGEKSLSCGMVMQDDTCADEDGEDHDCCDNEYTKVSTDDDFSKASFNIEFENGFFIAIHNPELTSIVVDTLKETVYTNYYPPPLIKDFPLLYESFLI